MPARTEMTSALLHTITLTDTHTQITERTHSANFVHRPNIRERSSVKYRVLNVHVESQGIFSFYRITISVNL